MLILLCCCVVFAALHIHPSIHHCAAANNLAGSLEKLKGQVDDVVIKFDMKKDPAIASRVDSFKKHVKTFEAFITTLRTRILEYEDVAKDKVTRDMVLKAEELAKECSTHKDEIKNKIQNIKKLFL